MKLKKFGQSLLQNARSGQALVEYVLILVLVAILFGVTLAATGPAIGNIFSNTVYNLLGQPSDTIEDLAEGRGRAAAFWETVQWLEDNPPQEAPIATNPALPPTDVPTLGPSLTPTDITPSPLPSLTPTEPPTSTPTDFQHTAPWIDTIDHPEWWRVDSSVYLGGDDWLGQYYANRELSGSPVYEIWNRQLGEEHRWRINFNWGNSGPRGGEWLNDNFSIRYTRNIYVYGTDPIQVQFTTASDDGTRLWLDYAPGCVGVSSGGPATGSEAVYTSGCLVIDDWNLQGADNPKTVVRTLSPGPHTLQLDYFEATAGAQVRLDITGTSSRNLDDRALPSGSPNCNWTRSGDSRANSLSFIWEENANQAEFPANMLCNLELRGSVDFSALTNPQLVFWDVWDLSAGTTVQLQVAEYNADPAQRNWQTINLRSANTTNYNWTRNVIDLASYASAWQNKNVALRFVMQNSGGSGNRRWYVDDIEIREASPTNRFFTVCSGTGTTLDQRQANCGSYWDLNAPAQRADFITSGRWDLTTSRPQTGSSWDDSYNTNYDNNFEGNDTSPRVHYIEFNGLIDLTGAVIPDAEGDDGLPQLNFYHAYDIGRRTTLALQWTRDTRDTTEDTWTNVGNTTLVPVNNSSAQSNLTVREMEVPLNTIPNWNTQPFRLRFAMLVPQTANSNPGWWIDNIYLNRAGRPRFADYPFFDDAEDGNSKWRMSGQWTASNEAPGVFGTGHAFSDSPGTNYTHNTNSTMMLRYPVDLNNDSPENLAPESDNIQTGPATRPVMSFWFRRNLASSDNLLLEWSKDQGITWTAAWQYIYNSSTSTVAAGISRTNRAWERVEVDLNFLQAGTAATANLYDDDVMLRFRLDATNNSSVADGVYIDDIRIANYTETSHRLWAASQNPGGYGNGDNIRYTDDVDSGNWFDRWYAGGDWASIDYDQHSRLLGLSENPDTNGTTRHETYQALQMTRIIDLRGVTATDYPTMYFWNRYYVGSNDRISVQVSVENGGYTRAAGETNYERVTGWDAWAEVWGMPADSRVDTWVRQQVSLDPYIGRRIKIRFVVNAYQGSNNRYGWRVDDVLIEHRKPTPITLGFRDNAQSLGNWFAEGTWGLAPDQWRGGGGGPAPLGSQPWIGTYFDCELVRGSRCNSVTDYNNTLYENFAAGTPRTFVSGRDLQEFVIDINHDFRSNGVPPGGVNIATWRDYYAARWTREINVPPGGGDFTFTTISDDGVRLRWDNIPAGGAPPGWNIINNWNYHGRTIDYVTVNFAEGTYMLTLEWFEGTGDATIIASAGKNSFSFTDSPKAGNGPAFPVVNSVPYGNSSLLLRRPLSLYGTTSPALEYYTRYRLGGTGYVEVSINGGFDWTNSGLSSGFTCPPGASCGSTVSGEYWPADAATWQLRQNNLNNYVNRFVNLRFRLNTTGSTLDGWYITDIEVNAASVVLPTPIP